MSGIIKEVQISKKDKERKNKILKNKERVSLFKSNLKEINRRNKQKYRNYWQLAYNHRQRKQNVTMSSTELEAVTFAFQDGSATN